MHLTVGNKGEGEKGTRGGYCNPTLIVHVRCIVGSLRIEYQGEVYHIATRGNAHRDVFLDDRDRITFIEILRGRPTPVA